MRAIERIIVKIVIVQFLFLIVTQVFFHNYNVFPELKQLTQYEGVTDQNFTELLETFGNNN